MILIYKERLFNCMRSILILFLLFFILSSYSQSMSKDLNAEELINKSKDITYTNPEQASYYANKAIQLLSSNLKEGEKNNLIAEAMLTYSLAAKLLGDFDLSIKMLHKAIDYVTSNNILLKGKIYSMMGIVYCSLMDYNAAIENNDKATALFKVIGDSAAIAANYNSRGIIHYSLEEFDLAERFLLQALKINRSLKLLKEVAANLNNLALYKGDSNEKIAYVKEAIAINRNLNAQWALGENYNNLGKQYYYAGQYNDALIALSISKNISTGIGAKELVADNYQYHSWVYIAIGDYEKAYNSFKELYKLSRELYSSSKLRAVEHDISNRRYEQQKRLAQKKEYDYEIKVLRLNILILIVLLILLISITFFVIKWYRRKKILELLNKQYELEQYQRQLAELKINQQKLELETAHTSLMNKRREVTAFAVFLQSRNDLLDKIREMIKKGYKMNHNQITQHLKKLNLFIAQYQSLDSYNTSLLLSVEENNQNFLNRLEKKHPDLTQGQKELSLLLCINLSTKEIALLTGKTPKTINMNRYRLRKTLNLSSDDSLSNYLQKI